MKKYTGSRDQISATIAGAWDQLASSGTRYLAAQMGYAYKHVSGDVGEFVSILPDLWANGHLSASGENWFWITFSARATERHRNRDHERPLAARRTRLRSRSKLARPNIWRFSILILLLWPSTAPEL
jgi:hypothetical protein